MAGGTQNQDKLNNTLLMIIKLLNEHEIKDWFIGFGTLLGIVRDNSCINHDDDVDIVIDESNFDKIVKILDENNFQRNYGYGIGLSRNIIKTVENDMYSSIDFYTSRKNDKGDVFVIWENVIWSECYPLVEYTWKNEKLYFPKNYISNLSNRYGESWRTPQKSKGFRDRKRI